MTLQQIEKPIKIILAVLLILCLFDMPYGYFQLLRYLAALVFIVLGYLSYSNGQQKVALMYFALAILFQPFFKISFGRTLWNIIDVIVAIGLLISAFPQTKRK